VGIRVAINGFGRIGRLVFRILEKDDRFEVVSINDLSDPKTLAHLARFDSTHGKFDGSISVAGEGRLDVNGREVEITAERDPAALKHADNGIDWVVEATGVFRTRAQLASCTTNCLAPVAKVLNDSFGIHRGLMTTVHAYTNDQRILDLVHSDLRRARSAAVNMIPTSTGAARAVGKVLPELAGKLDGCAIRVPVPDGSIVDLVAKVDRDVTIEEVNAALKAAAEGPMKGVLEFSEDPLVSTDIVGNPASCIYDSLATMVSGNLIKTLSWYDNEWGYSNRVVDAMAYTSSLDG
jgi:glyceraldehyde 3-phosphate dehydrogenase